MGAITNTAFNASQIHNFGNFMSFAGIGAVGGIAGAGTGGAIGSVFGSFWGTLAAGAAYGLIGGFGNAAYAGASFSQALVFGLTSAGIASATAGVLYGAGKVAGKAIDAIEKAANARAKAAGVKTPVGQQGKGSATSSLNANKGESASGSQALSSRGTEEPIDLGRIEVRKGAEPTGHRYVGPNEAASAAKTGYVPNTTETGTPKTVFYTPDEALNSASQASKAYNLEGIRTHRIGLDTSKTTNIYGGNVEGGTGIEMATEQKIPVVDVQKLDK